MGSMKNVKKLKELLGRLELKRKANPAHSENKYNTDFKKSKSKAKEYMDDPEKLKKLLDDAKKKSNGNRGALSEVWENLQLIQELILAWWKGEYKKIPKKSILLLIATLLYVVSPADAIPDFIAGLGFIDDVAIIGMVINQMKGDLENFKIWKNGKDDFAL